MIKLLGIVNIIFFFFMIIFLALKNSWFTIKKYTISDLANSEKTGLIFNICLFIFSINQVIFAITVYNSLLGYANKIALPLFIAGGIFLCIAALFPTNRYTKIHGYFAILCALSVSFGVILIAIGFLKINFIVGFFLLLITCALPLSYIFRKFLPGGLFEIPIFIIVSIWNLTFSLYLFKYF